jgi:hypothetical protein
MSVVGPERTFRKFIFVVVSQSTPWSWRHAQALLPAILLLTAASAAQATAPPNTLSTVGELASMCASGGAEARDRSALICWGYMRGVMDSYAELRSEATAQQICMPRDIDDIGLANTFMGWASRQRENLTMPAARGVYLALGEAFPCARH